MSFRLAQSSTSRIHVCDKLSFITSFCIDYVLYNSIACSFNALIMYYIYIILFVASCCVIAILCLYLHTDYIVHWLIIISFDLTVSTDLRMEFANNLVFVWHGRWFRIFCTVMKLHSLFVQFSKFSDTSNFLLLILKILCEFNMALYFPSIKVMSKFNYLHRNGTLSPFTHIIKRYT